MDLLDNDQPPVLDDLMGEGKKYSDSSAVAKALHEKDNFIKKLEEENQEMRLDITSRTSIEELLTKAAPPIKAPETEKPVETSHQQLPDPTGNTPPTEIDLQEEVLRLLKEEKAKDSRQNNVEAARKALVEHFGQDYNQNLKNIAGELGVSTSFLTDMAATSPSGLMKLVAGMSEPGDNRPSAPPTSIVETSKGFGTSATKNKAYYDNIRKTDMSAYLSKRVQSEMHDQALLLGSSFFS